MLFISIYGIIYFFIKLYINILELIISLKQNCFINCNKEEKLKKNEIKVNNFKLYSSYELLKEKENFNKKQKLDSEYLINNSLKKQEYNFNIKTNPNTELINLNNKCNSIINKEIEIIYKEIENEANIILNNKELTFNKQIENNEKVIVEYLTTSSTDELYDLNKIN